MRYTSSGSGTTPRMPRMQIFIELITLPEGRLLVDLLIWVWGGYSA